MARFPESGLLLQHFRQPRNVGSRDARDADVGSMIAGSIALGEVLKLQICVEQSTIVSACFRAYGCGEMIAVGSWLTEWLRGRSLQDALTLDNAMITQALDLPVSKVHCALLAQEAVQGAVADYRSKHASDKSGKTS